MHAFIHQLVRIHSLSSEAIVQLWVLAFPLDPSAQGRRLMALLGVVAGLFLGLGVIFWVAANWQDWGRMSKLVLLQALLSGAVLAAVALPRLRLSLLLMATLLLGGLLAFVGQTYQTGADPWQLFAAWAGLSLLWVLVARSDALWTFWVLLLGAGIALWSGGHLFTGVLFEHWRTLGIVTPCLWAGVVLVAGLAARYAIRLPAGRHAYAQRLAVLFALIAWSTFALHVVFDSSHRRNGVGIESPAVTLFLLNVGFILGLGLWLRAQRRLDVAAFSMVVLTGNVIALSILGRGLVAMLDKGHGDVWILAFLIFGLSALALLGLSGKWMLRLQAQQAAPGLGYLTNESTNKPTNELADEPSDQAQLFRRAQAAGVLPSDAALPESTPTPSWIVTVMSFIGAQFAVLPFLVLALFMLYGSEYRFAKGFIFGLICFGAALGLIHSHSPTLIHKGSPQGFMAQLGLTLILAGTGVMLFFELPLLLVAVMLLALALALRIQWIQSIVAFAGGLALANLWTYRMMFHWRYQVSDIDSHWGQGLVFVPLALAALWALWVAFEPRLSQRFGRAALLERASSVWDCIAAAVLATVAYRSSTLVQAALGNSSRTGTGSMESAEWGTASLWQWNTFAFFQALTVLVLGAWLAWRWGLLKQQGSQSTAHSTEANRGAGRYTLALLAIAYTAWALLSFVAHTNVAVCFIATLALATGRKRLLAFALLVLLAQLSGFYYALQWTLVQKAGLLVTVGAAVGAAIGAAYGLWGRGLDAAQRLDTPTHNAPEPLFAWLTARRTAGAVALGGIIALAAVSWDVRGKEQVIAKGQKIYIPLAPRDPRSIMQGDYMALNFMRRFDMRQMNNSSGNRLEGTREHPFLLAHLDGRGVATLLDSNATEAIGLAGNTAGYIRVPLKYKNGEWVVVTDAYYFPEGQGEPFTQTRFGEFRILPDGRALLVGMADEALKNILPAPKTTKQP